MNAKSAADFADRCRNDAEYRAKVHADPVAACAEYGIAVPDSRDVRVVENTGDTVYCVFPPDPNGAVSDDDLSWVAGGVLPGFSWSPQSNPDSWRPGAESLNFHFLLG